METSFHSIDWQDINASLNERGFAVVDNLITSQRCDELRNCYSEDFLFRKTVNMGRHQFGKGEYKYFTDPLPEGVQQLREYFYSPLAKIANDWCEKFADSQRWPDRFADFIEHCTLHSQTKPTPLMLRYQAGDYNRLHQDIYGEVYFPFQVIILLSEPEIDFLGGLLTLVENYPRMQSRPHGPMLKKGSAVIIPTQARPIPGKRDWRKATMRHGVTEVMSGERYTLGIIFHNA